MDEAVFSAMNLFWLNGFTNTSLDTLLDSMNIGKGSFYQAFDNKRDLYVKSLNLYKDKKSEFYLKITSRGKGLNRIKNFINSLIDEMFKEDFIARGCFFFNASIEDAGRDPDIMEIVQTGYIEFINTINEMVEEAQSMGEIDSKKEPEQISHLLFFISYGLLILAKSGFKKNKIKEIARNSLAILK